MKKFHFKKILVMPPWLKMGLKMGLKKVLKQGGKKSGLKKSRHQKNRVPTVALIAGGTAGHLFAALSVARAMESRNMAVLIMVDTRAQQYLPKSYAGNTRVIAAMAMPSTTALLKKPWLAPVMAAVYSKAFFQSLGMMLYHKVNGVVGFGGYPTVMPIVAAYLLGKPVCIHEQNAVMGRANIMVQKVAKVIALGFAQTHKTHRKFWQKSVVTGFAVRAGFHKLDQKPYQAPPTMNAPFHLLVFGGSQGAQVLSHTVTRALHLLPRNLRHRLKVFHQCRGQDLDTIRHAYKSLGIAATVAPFFHDMPGLMASAHLVIARAGAGTIGEVLSLARPCVLVPLPSSADNHQYVNARFVTSINAGWALNETNKKTAGKISGLIKKGMENPDVLKRASHAARRYGKYHGAHNIAVLMEKLLKANGTQGAS